MRKRILGFGLAMISVLALSFNNGINAQVEEGTILIDAFYGGPDLYKATLKTSYANSGTTQDVSISGVGPVGGKFEYLLSDLIGLGVNINYVSSGISYRDVSVDTSGSSVVYSYAITRNVMRFFPTINFHYGKDKVDGYSGIGVGFRTSSWKFESNDPDFDDTSLEGFLPVSFRMFTGLRYFFTENIGANFEFGLGGGGLIQGGLSVKF